MKENKELDDLLIVAEDWQLMQCEHTNRQIYDPNTRSHWNDIETKKLYYRAIGTKKQLNEFLNHKKESQSWEIDEVWEHDLQGSEKRDYYLNLYNNNNNEVVLIQII